MSGEIGGDDLVDALLGPVEPAFVGGVVVVVSAPTSAADEARSRAVARLTATPTLVVAAPGVDAPAMADLVDVVATSDEEVGLLRSAVERTPTAALSLAVLLRGVGERSVGEGLAAESAVFSTLQAGPEHAAWLAGRPRREHPADDVSRIRAVRRDDLLTITLARPAARNALDVAMRDELLEALAVGEADPSLTVELRGDGPSFCAGGDLDAFGSLPDPATAHVVRLRRSIGAVLDRLAPRTTAYVHGATAGSGVELAAFCGRVVAHPDSTFVLPEVSLGLIPGAGGTVSLPRRIGRHRTAWLALTGRTIDAATAHAWNLVDEIRLF